MARPLSQFLRYRAGIFHRNASEQTVRCLIYATTSRCHVNLNRHAAAVSFCHTRRQLSDSLVPRGDNEVRNIEFSENSSSERLNAVLSGMLKRTDVFNHGETLKWAATQLRADSGSPEFRIALANACALLSLFGRTLIAKDGTSRTLVLEVIESLGRGKRSPAFATSADAGQGALAPYVGNALSFSGEDKFSLLNLFFSAIRDSVQLETMDSKKLVAFFGAYMAAMQDARVATPRRVNDVLVELHATSGQVIPDILTAFYISAVVRASPTDASLFERLARPVEDLTQDMSSFPERYVLTSRSAPATKQLVPGLPISQVQVGEHVLRTVIAGAISAENMEEIEWALDVAWPRLVLAAQKNSGTPPDIRSQRAIVSLLLKARRTEDAVRLLVELGETGLATYADPWAMVFRRGMLPTFAKKSRMWTEIETALRELEPFVSDTRWTLQTQSSPLGKTPLTAGTFLDGGRLNKQLMRGCIATGQSCLAKMAAARKGIETVLRLDDPSEPRNIRDSIERRLLSNRW